MKLMIVTPTLGESAWIGDTVSSVETCALGGTHLLVAPSEAVEDVKERFRSVTVVPESGGGMYAAINTALRGIPHWDAFTYINDDDLLLPGFANVVEAVVRAGTTPVMSYGSVRLIDSEGRRIGAIPVSPFPSQNRDLYAQRIEPVYQHGTVVSRAAWEQHGGFDESFKFCGDSEYLARFCVKGVKAIHIPGEVAAFRLRSGQLTKNRAAMKEERARVDVKLGLLSERRTLRHLWAKLVFRTANAGVYLDRIRRHGIISFDELLERGR